jgi:regulator of RNase E activity RraA
MNAEAAATGFETLGTSTVSDALDRLGRPGACPGILPFVPQFRLCGRAFTLRYEPVDSHGGTVGDYIDDVVPGSVLVFDNQGRTDCTVWGDLLTFTAQRRGLAGTVIDGACRDITRSLELGYPLFARGRSMQTGKDRVRLESTGGEVRLGEVRVAPGDIVLGDADGIVVVGHADAAAVLEVAREIDAAESAIRAAVARGTRLDAARRDVGYHRLQAAERDAG